MSDEIRAARAASNAAIAARDVDAIVALLMPNYQVVTARNATRQGREASRASWTAIDVTYVRTPTEIRVSADDTQAHENGEWEGGGLRGVYSAKWLRDEDGAWRLLGEIFSTL
jgi:ketosteroid isomerase-like protein